MQQTEHFTADVSWRQMHNSRRRHVQAAELQLDTRVAYLEKRLGRWLDQYAKDLSAVNLEPTDTTKPIPDYNQFWRICQEVQMLRRLASLHRISALSQLHRAATRLKAPEPEFQTLVDDSKERSEKTALKCKAYASDMNDVEFERLFRADLEQAMEEEKQYLAALPALTRNAVAYNGRSNF